MDVKSGLVCPDCEGNLKLHTRKCTRDDMKCQKCFVKLYKNKAIGACRKCPYYICSDCFSGASQSKQKVSSPSSYLANPIIQAKFQAGGPKRGEPSTFSCQVQFQADLEPSGNPAPAAPLPDLFPSNKFNRVRILPVDYEKATSTASFATDYMQCSATSSSSKFSVPRKPPRKAAVRHHESREKRERYEEQKYEEDKEERWEEVRESRPKRYEEDDEIRNATRPRSSPSFSKADPARIEEEVRPKPVVDHRNSRSSSHGSRASIKKSQKPSRGRGPSNRSRARGRRVPSSSSDRPSVVRAQPQSSASPTPGNYSQPQSVNVSKAKRDRGRGRLSDARGRGRGSDARGRGRGRGANRGRGRGANRGGRGGRGASSSRGRGNFVPSVSVAPSVAHSVAGSESRRAPMKSKKRAPMKKAQKPNEKKPKYNPEPKHPTRSLAAQGVKAYSKGRRAWHCNVREVKLQEEYREVNSAGKYKVVISGKAPKKFFNKNKKRKENSQWAHLPKKHYKSGKQSIFEFDLAKAILHRESRKMSVANDTDFAAGTGDMQADGNTIWVYTNGDEALDVNIRQLKQKCLIVVGKAYTEKEFYRLCSQLGDEGGRLHPKSGPDRDKYNIVGYSLDKAASSLRDGASDSGFSCAVMKIRKYQLWDDQPAVIQLKRKRYYIPSNDGDVEISANEAIEREASGLEYSEDVSFEPSNLELGEKRTMGFVFNETPEPHAEWSATASYGNNTKLVETFRKEITMRNFLRTKFINHRVQGVDGDVHVTSANLIDATENLAFWDPVYAASAKKSSPIKFLMGVFDASAKIDRSRAKNRNAEAGVQLGQHVLDVEGMTIGELAYYYDETGKYTDEAHGKFYHYANKGEKKEILFPTDAGYFDSVKVWHKLILKSRLALEIIDILRADYGEDCAGLVTMKGPKGTCVIISNLEYEEYSPVKYLNDIISNGVDDFCVGDIIQLNAEQLICRKVIRKLPPLNQREREMMAVDFSFRKFDNPFFEAFSNQGVGLRAEAKEKKPSTKPSSGKQNRKHFPARRNDNSSRQFTALKAMFHSDLSLEFQEDLAFYLSWYEYDGKERHKKGKTKWKLDHLTPLQLQEYLQAKPPHFPKSHKQSFLCASVNNDNDFPLRFPCNGNPECWMLEEMLYELDWVEVGYKDGKDVVKAKGWSPKELWYCHFARKFTDYFDYDLQEAATCMHKDNDY